MSSRAFERSLRDSSLQDGLRAQEVAHHAATQSPHPRPERSRSRGVQAETRSSNRRNMETQEHVVSNARRDQNSTRGREGRLAWNMGGKLNSLQAENQRMCTAIESLERKVWQLSGGQRSPSPEPRRGAASSHGSREGGLHASVMGDKLRQDHSAALDLIARQKEGLQGAADQIQELSKQNNLLKARNAELELEIEQGHSREKDARHKVDALEAELQSAKQLIRVPSSGNLDVHSSTATSILEKERAALLEAREELLESRTQCHQLEHQLAELQGQHDMLLAGRDDSTGLQRRAERSLQLADEQTLCRVALERKLSVVEEERQRLSDTLKSREAEITELSLAWCTQSDMQRSQQHDQEMLRHAIRQLSKTHKFLKSGLASFGKRQQIGRSDELGIAEAPERGAILGDGAATSLAGGSSPAKSVVWPHRHKRGIGLGLLELVEHCSEQLSSSLAELQTVSFQPQPGGASPGTQQALTPETPQPPQSVLLSPRLVLPEPVVDPEPAAQEAQEAREPVEDAESALGSDEREGEVVPASRVLPLPASPESREAVGYTEAKEKNALRAQLIQQTRENAALRAELEDLTRAAAGVEECVVEEYRAKVLELEKCVEEQNELIATLNHSIEGLLAR